jgi:hypothetical protein
MAVFWGFRFGEDFFEGDMKEDLKRRTGWMVCANRLKSSFVFGSLGVSKENRDCTRSRAPVELGTHALILTPAEGHPTLTQFL